MIGFVIASALVGQCGAQTACHVQRVVTSHVTTPYVQHVVANHHAVHVPVAFTYKVPDPEVERLQRQNEKLQEALIEELRERRKEVQQLQQAAATAVTEGADPGQASKANTPEALLVEACGKCHTKGKAAGDFEFSFPLTIEQKLLAEDAIRRATMPPKSAPRQLTAEEQSALSAYLALNADDRAGLKAKKKGSK